MALEDVLCFKEHRKAARPSTRKKHQRGTSRREKEQEKKREREKRGKSYK